MRASVDENANCFADGLHRYFKEDTRIIPLYGAGVSVVLLALHAVQARWTRSSPKYASVLRPEGEGCAAETVVQRNTLHCLLQRAGGRAIFLAKSARLVCCVLLLGLSLATLLGRHDHNTNASWWPEFVECEVYVSLTLS